MRFWAIRFIATTTKIGAVAHALFGVLWYVLVLIGNYTLIPSLRGLLQYNADTFIAVFMIASTLLALWLIGSVGIYASGQFLQLMLSLEQNVRGLRGDIRRLADRPAMPDYAPLAPNPPQMPISNTLRTSGYLAKDLPIPAPLQPAPGSYDERLQQYQQPQLRPPAPPVDERTRRGL